MTQNPLSKKVFLGVTIAFAIVYLNTTLLLIALPSIQHNFHASLRQILWLVNIFILMRALIAFGIGQFCDILTYRKALILSLFVFSLASLACAFAPSINLLIFFRGIQGLGAAVILVSSMSLITSQTEKQARGRIIGIVTSVGLTNLAFGPLLSGLIIHFLSWEWIFIVNFCLSLFCCGIILSSKHVNAQSEKNNQFDYLGFISISLSTLFITLACENITAWGVSSFLFVSCCVTAIIAFMIFFKIEKQKKNPLIDFELFKLVNFTPSMIITSLAQIILLSMIFIGLYLQDGLDFSPLKAGVLLLPMVSLGVISSNIGGYLVDKYSTKIPVVYGNVLVALGFIITVLIFKPNSYLVLLPLLLFVGTGIFMILGPIRTTMLNKIPIQVYGMVNSSLTGIRTIISVLAFAILSSIFTTIIKKTKHVMKATPQKFMNHQNTVATKLQTISQHSSTHGFYAILIIFTCLAIINVYVATRYLKTQ